MPAWLLAALRMMGIGAASGAGFVVAEQALTDGGGPFAVGTGGGHPPMRFDRFGHEVHKRRRRRRALTASDRADIGFIVGLLGPAAGKNFAVTLAARTR